MEYLEILCFNNFAHSLRAQATIDGPVAPVHGESIILHFPKNDAPFSSFKELPNSRCVSKACFLSTLVASASIFAAF